MNNFISFVWLIRFALMYEYVVLGNLVFSEIEYDILIGYGEDVCSK